MEKLAIRLRQEIKPALQKEMGLSTISAVPVPTKVVINVGVGRMQSDANYLEYVAEQLTQITGQKPSVRRAKKSIAGFKLREGVPVGYAVTLRGKRMFDFIDRLINVALPRVRDFKGLNPKAFDGHGNYNIGLKEHTVFPEIVYESADKVMSLEITIVTNAGNDDDARMLLRALGLPFKEDSK